MLTDGLSFFGSSVATNFTIISGNALPDVDNEVGRIFYLLTGATPGLYVYKPTGWAPISSAAGASLTTANTFTKAQSIAPVTLTSGATINTDASLSNNFHLLLTSTGVLANPTNLTAGQTLNYQITQDANGARALTFGSLFKWTGGTAPTLSSAAGSVDFVSAYYNGSVLISSIIKDVK